MPFRFLLCWVGGVATSSSDQREEQVQTLRSKFAKSNARGVRVGRLVPLRASRPQRATPFAKTTHSVLFAALTQQGEPKMQPMPKKLVLQGFFGFLGRNF